MKLTPEQLQDSIDRIRNGGQLYVEAARVGVADMTLTGWLQQVLGVEGYRTLIHESRRARVPVPEEASRENRLDGESTPP